MSDTPAQTSSGIGFSGLLAIVFITLKLTHAINWSWWWVLAPLWGSFLLWLGIVAIIAAIACIVALWGYFKRK